VETFVICSEMFEKVFASTVSKISIGKNTPKYTKIRSVIASVMKGACTFCLFCFVVVVVFFFHFLDGWWGERDVRGHLLQNRVVCAESYHLKILVTVLFSYQFPIPYVLLKNH